MTTLVAAGATDVGRVRTSNEDEYLLAEPLYAVADGMGGHAAGEVASATAMDALQASFDGNRTVPGLAGAVRDANRAVWEQSRQSSELRGMGTTMTAVALVEEGDDEILAIANVGDSRAYLLRDGELDQLTDDHSVVEELRRAGRLSSEEAASDPRRHVLTRVLGVDADVEVDSFEVIPYQGDRLLLASDGLFGDVSDEEIAAVLRRRSDPERVAQQLVAMAKDAGGADNITVVVIDVTDDDRSARASTRVQSGWIAAEPQPVSARRVSDTAPDTAQMPRAVPAETEPPPAPQQPVPEAAAPAPAPAPKKRRRLNIATVAFLLVLALLLASATAAILISARGSYFVGVQGDEVVIFKGKPGGLLGFQPTLEERPGLRLADVLPSRAEELRRGKEAPSLDRARSYVRNIEEEARAAAVPPPTTTPRAPLNAPPPATVP
ncbi:MAG: Stp1/IreP family PP2C-type Ser/Thr phosphatase [Actinomycetota bacterium]|nr:Stp1/IreP family PP2C-type Ser/Thr phosphatase [Actinomycetota bacterium]